MYIQAVISVLREFESWRATTEGLKVTNRESNIETNFLFIDLRKLKQEYSSMNYESIQTQMTKLKIQPRDIYLNGKIWLLWKKQQTTHRIHHPLHLNRFYQVCYFYSIILACSLYYSDFNFHVAIHILLAELLSVFLNFFILI